MVCFGRSTVCALLGIGAGKEAGKELTGPSSCCSTLVASRRLSSSTSFGYCRVLPDIPGLRNVRFVDSFRDKGTRFSSRSRAPSLSSCRVLASSWNLTCLPMACALTCPLSPSHSATGLVTFGALLTLRRIERGRAGAAAGALANRSNARSGRAAGLLLAMLALLAARLTEMERLRASSMSTSFCNSASSRCAAVASRASSSSVARGTSCLTIGSTPVPFRDGGPLPQRAEEAGEPPSPSRALSEWSEISPRKHRPSRLLKGLATAEQTSGSRGEGQS